MSSAEKKKRQTQLLLAAGGLIVAGALGYYFFNKTPEDPPPKAPLNEYIPVSDETSFAPDIADDVISELNSFQSNTTPNITTKEEEEYELKPETSEIVNDEKKEPLVEQQPEQKQMKTETDIEPEVTLVENIKTEEEVKEEEEKEEKDEEEGEVNEEIVIIDTEDQKESMSTIEQVISPLELKCNAYVKKAHELKQCPFYRYKNGTLVVNVISASNLDNMDSGKHGDVSDPYVKLEVKHNKAKKTHFIENDLNPVWNETFTFEVADAVIDQLICTVFDKDAFTKNDKIGVVCVKIIDVVAAHLGVLKKEYVIEGSKTGGKLLLNLAYTED